MGEVITVAKPYFRWVTAYHREEDPERRLQILKNELSLLAATETVRSLKRALVRIVNPQPNPRRIKT